MAVAARVCVRDFYYIPLGFMSVFVPAQCCFYYYASIVCSLKSGIVIPPVLLFGFRIVFIIQGLLCFHMNFSILVKNIIGILIGITLNNIDPADP
jgi:hypothetical protein